MKFVAVTSDESDSDSRINVVECWPPSTPIMVTLAVDRRKLTMEVNTRAAYSVTTEETYRDKFADIKLCKSKVLLKTYTNEHISVVGQLNVQVQYGEQQATLALLVVAGNGPALLGCTQLAQRHPTKLELNTRCLRSICSTDAAHRQVWKTVCRRARNNHRVSCYA